jgi:RNA polymerase sigma-70 factor (ECF subfamily)
MDTELVVRAQDGDEGAFASLAMAVGDRLHAVAHRILRDIDLAEDATQQALLSVWRDLPQLRDPARFEAWSYRLLVRACYAEARRTRRWAPNLRLLSADEPAAADGLTTVVDRDQLERGFRRLSIDHRAVVVLHHYLDLPLDQVAETASRSGRCDPDFITRCAGCTRRSMPMRDPRRERLRNEHRMRRHPHRSVVAE